MIAGGGTGGHTSPAGAILEELQKRDPRLIAQWVGCRRSIEERVSAAMSIPFRSLPVEGWPRNRTPRRIWVALKLVWSIARAWVYLRKFRPQIVLGVGGYVSLPLMWTAQRMNIPTVIHEQNRLLGVANRLLAPRSSRILLSFPETKGEYPKERSRVVGNPVRAAFANPPDKIAAREAFGLNPSVPVVLVCGGSQGARRINSAMKDAVTRSTPDEAQFIWMTGQSDASTAREAAAGAGATVLVYPYIDDMAGACAAADLIVSRSGASTTAEIALLGKPSILIPYPHATDDHQRHNARTFVDAGAAVLLEDDACTADALVAAVRDLVGRPSELERMGHEARKLAKPHATEDIVEEILSLVFGDSSGEGHAPTPSRD
jgi:UDP-N-acetylglucosamine--N-acetylmuramyl-(pentapeptide) pyrophosphoryl-undecaprenol N-acetylglucosamine transferase